MPKKILLADDSITIQKVVELTFSDGDYEVIATNNGAKAIQRLAETRPDIILSDIIMPERNGYEVCEYVKSHPEFRHIPVILLTGTFEPFDPDRAEKAGCDAVVTKPFESQSLIHKVEELIQQSRRPEEEAIPAAAPFEPPAAPSAPQMPPSFDDFEPAQPASFQEQPLAGSDPWDDSSLPSASTGEDAPFAQQEESNPAQPLFTDFDDAPPPASQYQGNGAEEYGSEIFSSASDASTSYELPLEEPADDSFAGETRAFPMLDFGALSSSEQREQEQPEMPAGSSDEQDEEHDFDETASFVPRGANSYGAGPDRPVGSSTVPPEGFGGESSSFEEAPSFDASAGSLAAHDEGEIDPGQTKLIPKLSYDELMRMREQPDSDAFPDAGAEPPLAADVSEGGEAFAATAVTSGTGELPFDSVDEPYSAASSFSLYEEPIAAGETDAFSTDPISLEEAESEGLLTSPALEPDTPEELETSSYDEELHSVPSSYAAAESFAVESAEDDFERAPTMEKPFDAGRSTEYSPWSDAPAAAGEEASESATSGWAPGERTEQTEVETAAKAPWEEELATPAMSEPSPWDEEPSAGEPAWSDSPAASAGEPARDWAGSSDAEPAATDTSWATAESNSDAFAPDEEPLLHAGASQLSEEPAESEISAIPEDASTGTSPGQEEAQQEARPAAAFSGELSDEQVEKIARRVVEMISERWVRDVAWEVVPDMAEMIVKERIRQLESES
jgi:CheY-like chemotaxis protein